MFFTKDRDKEFDHIIEFQVCPCNFIFFLRIDLITETLSCFLAY
jgi:hypothetical protein